MTPDPEKPVPWRDWYRGFFAYLERTGLHHWRHTLDGQLRHRFEQRPHGDTARWLAALAALPPLTDIRVRLDEGQVGFASARPLEPSQRARLEKALRALMPWRKGPFDFFGIEIDTEWRSDWKWQRIAPRIGSLGGQSVLDVGCGSGYHCWRMLGAGAERVVGIDPGLLFLCQFQAARYYADQAARAGSGPQVPIDLLPLKMEEIPPNLRHFDTVFSMGVLYHRRSPFDHLAELHGCLKAGGQLVLETLVVDGPAGYSLVPRDRYAMMRNVWFIPSTATLRSWLERMGFVAVELVDVTGTTTAEQRRTDWMRFQSLRDFLDPEDAGRTREGYPAPVRATFIARKPA